MVEFIDGFATKGGHVLAYHFEQVSGEMLGKSLVYVSEGCGLASGQTVDAPPRSKSGFAVVRVNDEWQLLEDHRGTVFNTENGEAVIYAEFGPLPADLTPLPRPSAHHRWSGSEWVLDQVAFARAEREEAVAQALALLSSTDWYVIRQHETGLPVPETVLASRMDARQFISDAREQDHV